MFNNIAIIAGSGKLPFKIASYLKKLNVSFIILAIKGYSKINLYKNFKTYPAIICTAFICTAL